MIFYLGTHHPAWLEQTSVPLFISRRSLARRRGLPRARGPWALDSGGFSELSLHGAWTLCAREYVAQVRRFSTEIGGLAWAAPRDWMCEPDILRKTGLSVAEHQRRTVADYLELRALAPELPFIPVLQGWAPGDYDDCAELYARAGVDLAALPLVGLGSVCRRQNALRASHIVSGLAADGLKLHGFGFKRTGLGYCAGELASADSLAWSFHARREPPLPGHKHASCANCLEFALAWREETLAGVERAQRAA